MITENDFTKIKHDINGNPRYVIHFLQCLPDRIRSDYQTMTISEKYKYACKLMNKIGGKKFHNKQYGGGIVFQSCSLDDTIRHIEWIRNKA